VVEGRRMGVEVGVWREDEGTEGLAMGEGLGVIEVEKVR